MRTAHLVHPQPGEQVDVVVPAVDDLEGLPPDALQPETGPQHGPAGRAVRSGDRHLEPAQSLAEERVIGRDGDGALQGVGIRIRIPGQDAQPARTGLDANLELSQSWTSAASRPAPGLAGFGAGAAAEAATEAGAGPGLDSSWSFWDAEGLSPGWAALAVF